MKQNENKCRYDDLRQFGGEKHVFWFPAETFCTAGTALLPEKTKFLCRNPNFYIETDSDM